MRTGVPKPLGQFFNSSKLLGVLIKEIPLAVFSRAMRLLPQLGRIVASRAASSSRKITVSLPEKVPFCTTYVAHRLFLLMCLLISAPLEVGNLSWLAQPKQLLILRC